MIARTVALIALLVTLGVSTASVAHDEPGNADHISTGNTMISFCNEEDHQKHNDAWAMCVFYVGGVLGGVNYGQILSIVRISSKFTKPAITESGLLIPFICLPNNVTNEQEALVYSKYLRDHPELLNKDADLLVIQAMQAVWHCHVGQQQQ